LDFIKTKNNKSDFGENALFNSMIKLCFYIKEYGLNQIKVFHFIKLSYLYLLNNIGIRS